MGDVVIVGVGAVVRLVVCPVVGINVGGDVIVVCTVVWTTVVAIIVVGRIVGVVVIDVVFEVNGIEVGEAV